MKRESGAALPEADEAATVSDVQAVVRRLHIEHGGRLAGFVAYIHPATLAMLKRDELRWDAAETWLPGVPVIPTTAMPQGKIRFEPDERPTLAGGACRAVMR